MTRNLRIYLLNGLAILALFSCSNDDDVKPTDSLENARLSFADKTEIVEVPTELKNSSNIYAQQAAGYIQEINSMGTYTSNFLPPSGAVKTSSPVTASNGRVARTNKEYLVYTWEDSGYGITYQVSESGDNYVFEIFYKLGATGDYLKFVHAEESKSGKSGSMKIYNIFAEGEESKIFVNYAWNTDADGTISFVADFVDTAFKYEVKVRTDGSGEVKYLTDGKLVYHMVWTVSGDGTWKLYEEGSVVSEGSWTA